MEGENTNKDKYERMYEQILNTAIKREKDNNIIKILKNISANNKLSKKEKEMIYDEIFEYTNKINKTFETKIEEIHKNGIKEGSIMSIISNNENNENEERTLYLELEEFILERLQDNSKLNSNNDYINTSNEINQIKNQINSNELTLINKLYDLFNFRTDIETIEAYKIGFKDSIKFFSEIFESKLNIK